MTFTHAFTRDLETEGHVMVYVTFVISACIYPTALIVLLFRKDFRSGNSFQLSPFAWPPCLTVLSGFQVKEFILTIATCVTITCDLET